MTDSLLPFDPAPILASLPNLPGVYRMLGEAGEILYVGKARDLKKRVSSYFQKSDQSPRIRLMVAHIRDIQITVTRSESEALLLENNLIKGLAPKYNILFRDDKSYPWLLLTGHAFPRLAYFRGTPDTRDQAFGPFPNSYAVRESLHILQKVFRLRTCEDTVFGNRSRPCLLHQIKRCSGPCAGLIAREDYARDVANAMLFLQGKDDKLMADLMAKMATAAAALRFEDAALHRDQVQALARVREKQFVESRGARDADVVGLALKGGAACVYLMMIRAGRNLGGKAYFPSNADQAGPALVLEAFLSQHYAGLPAPAVLVLGARVEGMADWLNECAGHKVQVVGNPIGERRNWLRMAEHNAELALIAREGQRAGQAQRLAALNEALGETDIERIECFDVSHTQGEATVVSCVVYDNGGMKASDYRRFNIDTPTPGDDYYAMREALTRRYSRLAKGEGKLPDLLLIDGGRGQLNVALAVLNELGLGQIAMLGVAKGEARKPGLEQLVLPDEKAPLRLPPDHPALHLIQEVRDEAHRFAITGHRAQRAKKRTTSSLEDIAGIGPKRRQRLLQTFGGLRGIQSAGIEEIAQVEGMSRALAEKLYRALH
ncbi:MAG: excinuclease ABC subunit C [Hydrogenophilales bacterium CG03_land_8_20_14_0_80_62_28]|nr:MAG: excinuclease ABC subunit C [Hydrogenophilales bacterium CG03_land_8_20_14_0_80_62_28]PIW38338.1 MAG: excinuclease ABC subunit C [Hydrogenophilales bacterium CG15_BIG_FIL_POST_REV_8_21_14_020_62_31]